MAEMMNEYTPEMEQLALRRKYADMLRQQSMQPLQGGMAGRTVAPIHWTQGLAQMLKGASADATDQRTTQGTRALAGRMGADRKRTLAEALAKARGIGQEANPMGAAEQMAGSTSFPDLQKLGMGAIGQEFTPQKPMVVGRSLMDQRGKVLGTDPTFAQEKEADREARMQEIMQRGKEREDQIRLQAQEGRLSREEADKRAFENRQEMARVMATLRAPREEPAPVAVTGPDGKPMYVSRRDAIGKSPANLDPSLQGTLAGAKRSATDQAAVEARRPQATAAKNTMEENLQNLKTNLGELKSHKGLSGITGAVYGRLPSVADDSMAAQAIYENVVNNVFVNALQSMRAASKTGGAVGNVSDKEGDRLEQTLAALSRAQGTADFKNQLDKAIARLDLAKKNISQAYEQEYGRRSTDQRTSSDPSDPLGLR